MKKLFFMMAFAASASLGFAQAEVQPTMVNLTKEKINMSKLTKRLPADKAAMTIGRKATPNKTAATGNYYTRPEGSMYVDYSKEGYGFSATLLNVTAYNNAVFTNMNANPASTIWQWGNYTDASTVGLVDENYNFVWQGYPTPASGQSINTYPYPVLVSGNDSYYFGMESGRASAIVSTTWQGVADALSFTHSNIGGTYYGFADGYGFGPGTATLGDGVTYTNIGVMQSFEKPMTPLYVEDIFLSAVSNYNDSEPLKNGATLTMNIYDDQENLVATLTASADDLVALDNADMGEGWGQTYFWNLVFSQTENDPLMGEVTVPFTISTAFTVEILGLDNPDVNIGFYLFQSAAEDVIPAGYTIGVNPATQEVTTYSYNGGYSIPMTFTGFFDNIDVMATLSDGENDYENSNVIRISEDGASCMLDNGADEGVYVYTAAPWITETGENYYYEVATSSDGSGDWVGACSVIDLWEGNYGLNVVTFSASACPSGEGRWAVVNIVGHGVTSATPIILLQGTATLADVEIPSGIQQAIVDNGAKADDPNAPVYNLNGQRVSKDTKGILIQNGKKFINK